VHAGAYEILSDRILRIRFDTGAEPSELETEPELIEAYRHFRAHLAELQNLSAGKEIVKPSEIVGFLTDPFVYFDDSKVTRLTLKN
jgi:hypothetical protein